MARNRSSLCDLRPEAHYLYRARRGGWDKDGPAWERDDVRAWTGVRGIRGREGERTTGLPSGRSEKAGRLLTPHFSLPAHPLLLRHDVI